MLAEDPTTALCVRMQQHHLDHTAIHDSKAALHVVRQPRMSFNIYSQTCGMLPDTAVPTPLPICGNAAARKRVIDKCSDRCDSLVALATATACAPLAPSNTAVLSATAPPAATCGDAGTSAALCVCCCCALYGPGVAAARAVYTLCSAKAPGCPWEDAGDQGCVVWPVFVSQCVCWPMLPASSPSDGPFVTPSAGIVSRTWPDDPPSADSKPYTHHTHITSRYMLTKHSSHPEMTAYCAPKNVATYMPHVKRMHMRIRVCMSA